MIEWVMSFRFKKFKVYHDAKKLHRAIVFITKSYPPSFFYLRDQIRRSALSVVLQIAEGSAKRSDRDFNRYLEIGMGSVAETAANLEIGFEEGLIDRDNYRRLTELCQDIIRQLGGFSKKLRESRKGC